MGIAFQAMYGIRKYCWNLTEYPETSLLARVGWICFNIFISLVSKIYAFTSMGVVILSTLVFILSTMPELTDDIDMIPLTNTTDSHQSVERWEDVSKEILM